ncbi:hypothetical protein [Aurantibacillus circumpalustris]|uniref:hypothetical protein n=1 Tax=Aurantibacillus circumpalustris TaxID=3036359 RepID=UPI00295AA558|nr:hypothetical protein [Aurantibacillus circumpalustris]
MDRNKDLDKYLGELMSVEALDMVACDISLVLAARKKVAARKKTIRVEISFIDQLTGFFRFDLKFYHVGVSVLLISAGLFYVNEPNYNSSVNAGFMEYKDALSITNTTISVNSTTMLTSIPTMVIRN